MPKPSNRLTKAAVLEEIKILRNKMAMYTGLGSTPLEFEYDNLVGKPGAVHPSREYMIYQLFMAATFHMTNVLNLE